MDHFMCREPQGPLKHQKTPKRQPNEFFDIWLMLGPPDANNHVGVTN